MNLWNPEMGYLNKQLYVGIISFFSLQLTLHKCIMDCVIRAILDNIFLLLRYNTEVILIIKEREIKRRMQLRKILVSTDLNVSGVHLNFPSKLALKSRL
jgi:hypothetical protein